MTREPRHVQVDLPGVVLHVLHWSGSRPLVLALHGRAGCGREWDRFAVDAGDRGVVAPDLRGHGWSGWADSYAVDAHVGDVEALIERFGAGPVVVVGHSLGGIVGFSLAAIRPDLVAGVVVADVGPELPRAARAQLAARRGRRVVFNSPDEAFSVLREGNPFASDDAIRHRVEHGIVQRSAGCWTWRHDPQLDEPRPDAMTGLWARWRMTTAPTLAIRGEHSPYLTEDIAARMASSRPGVRLATIPSAGHNVHTDQPTAFHATVADWLQP
jgi:esterase